MFRKLKVISRLTFSLKQEPEPFLYMRTVANTMLNSSIRELDGYKKLIKSHLLLRLEQMLLWKYI